MKKMFFTTVMVLGLLATQAQSIIYVKPGGAGNRDGSNWANAYGDLQDAINDASVRPPNVFPEIWVAETSPYNAYVPTQHIPNGVAPTFRDNPRLRIRRNQV